MKTHTGIFALFLFLHVGYISLAQEKLASNSNKKPDSSIRKPELFTAGLFDVMNNGQMNVAARFIKLYVGEPRGIYIPVSVFSGVTSNNLKEVNSAKKTNDHLYNNFINPTTGLANICIDDIIFFDTSASKHTNAGFHYQFGERLLSGFKAGSSSDPYSGKPVNFVNTYASAGFIFKTGAWEKSNSGNIGLCWISLRYIVCYSNKEQLTQLIPGLKTSGIYHGYSVGWGIEITNLLNLKVLYYKYVKEPEIEYGRQIYQFSCNYSLK